MTINNMQPTLVLNSSISQNDATLGTIRTFGFNFEIGHDVDGSALAISQAPDLYSYMGSAYGGDDSTLFNLPDFEGRLMVGAGTGPGLTPVSLGQETGSNTVTLTEGNLPSNYFGDGDAVENTQESTGIHYYIAVAGFYPSRNASPEAGAPLAEESNNVGDDIAFLGQMIASASASSTVDWMRAEGQLLSINDFTALFSLIGTTYGGDGRTTFALPDMRGRVAIGAEDNVPGGIRLGTKLGTEDNTLVPNNLPSPDGSSVALDNYQPSLAINFIIALVGVYPHSSSDSIAHDQNVLGEIKMFAGNFAPRGYAMAEGQLLPISQYSALFSLYGTTYGGDGETTFALPDLRGRAIVDDGSGFPLGAKLGDDDIVLFPSDVPFIPTLTVSITEDSIAEDGTSEVTITRDGPTTEALVVTISSSDSGEATGPTTATIPAGETSVTITLTGVDDGVFDDDQTVTISVTSTEARTDTDTIIITNDDGINFVGTANDELITGTEFDDMLNGMGGNDTIEGGGGNDTINGGEGLDYAIFNGNVDEFDLAINGDHRTMIVGTTIEGGSGVDELNDVEVLQFDDAYVVGGVTFETSEVRFDTADDKPWEIFATSHDADGVLTDRVRLYDSDAMTVEVFVSGELSKSSTFDFGGNYNYDSIVSNFDETGVITDRTITYDSGFSKKSTYTDGVLASTTSTDGGDQFKYDTITLTYDAAGLVASNVRTIDNGIVKTQIFTDGVLTQTRTDDSDQFFYNSIVTDFEADGDRSQKVTTYDDGVVRTEIYVDDLLTTLTQYDVENAKEYQVLSSGYNTDGSKAYSIRIGDDDIVTTTGVVPDGAVDALLT